MTAPDSGREGAEALRAENNRLRGALGIIQALGESAEGGDFETAHSMAMMRLARAALAQAGAADSKEG